MPEYPYKPVDLSKIRTCSLQERGGLVHVEQFAKLTDKGCSFGEWLDALPEFLGVKALRGLAEAIIAARQAGKPVIWAMGGHVVKVGCGPIVCDLMRRGVVTALAMNGATATHDVELALCGQTSEDVGKALVGGVFGMAEETANIFGEAVCLAKRDEVGLGGAIGRILLQRKAVHANISILATAAELGVPATVHVALGTDVVHMHPSIEPGLLGEASLWDFRMLCSIVADLGIAFSGATRRSPTDAGPVANGMASDGGSERGAGGSAINGATKGAAAEVGGASGGLWVNIGSAVILPEVFLKTVAVARNMGISLDGMVTANLDMMRQYRTRVNVLNRPVGGSGKSFEIIGQHEILLPLLRQAVVERNGQQPVTTAAPAAEAEGW